MTKETYRKLCDAVRADCQRKLDALKMVYDLASGTTSRRKGWLAKAARDAVDRVDSTFNVRDIEEEILDAHPEYAAALDRMSISSALRRFEEAGRIQSQKRGAGRRGTVYEKTTPPP
jgi:hypothetical protein